MGGGDSLREKALIKMKNRLWEYGAFGHSDRPETDPLFADAAFREDNGSQVSRFTGSIRPRFALYNCILEGFLVAKER